MTAREWGYEKLCELLQKYELDDDLRTVIECVEKVVKRGTLIMWGILIPIGELIAAVILAALILHHALIQELDDEEDKEDDKD